MKKQHVSMALALTLAGALPFAAASPAQAVPTATQTNAIVFDTKFTEPLAFDAAVPTAEQADVILIKKGGGRGGKRGGFGRSRGAGKHGSGIGRHGVRDRGGASDAIRGFPRTSSRNSGANFFERLFNF